MTTRLDSLIGAEVSAVSRAANRKKWLLLKGDDEARQMAQADADELRALVGSGASEKEVFGKLQQLLQERGFELDTTDHEEPMTSLRKCYSLADLTAAQFSAVAKGDADVTLGEAAEAELGERVRPILAGDPLLGRPLALAKIRKTAAGSALLELSLSPLAGLPFGEALARLERDYPDSFVRTAQALGVRTAALVKAFATTGGSAGDVGTAQAELDRIASEIGAKFSNLSPQQCMARAVRANPRLCRALSPVGQRPAGEAV